MLLQTVRNPYKTLFIYDKYENTAPAMIAKQTVYARKNQTFLLTFSSLFLRNLIF